jgi:hypothetical protein
MLQIVAAAVFKQEVEASLTCPHPNVSNDVDLRPPVWTGHR